MRIKYLIRDNKWIITPALYILLLLSASLIYLNKNSNNELIENRDISVDSISIGDKVEISEFETLQGLDSKLLNEITASDLNNLFYKDTFLQNLSAVKSVYIVGPEGDVSGVGYVAEGAENCKKLKYFSYSENGKYYVVEEDRSISKKLEWNSEKNRFVFNKEFLIIREITATGLIPKTMEGRIKFCNLRVICSP